jgi:hypothetical protein
VAVFCGHYYYYCCYYYYLNNLRSFNASNRQCWRPLYVPHSGHYMYRTVGNICTAQRSLYVPHSGHYMYRTVVTICTTSLTLNNSTFSPHSCIYVFSVDLRTNSHYFPIQH